MSSFVAPQGTSPAASPELDFVLLVRTEHPAPALTVEGLQAWALRALRSRGATSATGSRKARCLSSPYEAKRISTCLLAQGADAPLLVYHLAGLACR